MPAPPRPSSNDQDDRPHAVVIRLGRRQAMGEAAVVRSIEAILRAGGWRVSQWALLDDHPAGPVRMLIGAPRAAFSRRVVPERVVWDVSSVVHRLAIVDPDAVVCITARTYDPRLAGDWALVLDYVDRMSENYLGRAAQSRNLLRTLLFRLLAWRTAWFESLPPRGVRATVAAGRRDADELGATWIPNVVTDWPALLDVQPDVDLGFVGTLSYPPNVAAVDRLARIWPELRARRPGTTMLLAGARPTAHVRSLVAANGWLLEADFASLPDIMRRIRIALAPMPMGTGLQSKVLEAAMFAVPQVVANQVMAGFDDSFPVVRTESDGDLVRAIIELLEDPHRRRALGLAARRHVAAYYAPEAWVATLNSIIAS